MTTLRRTFEQATLQQRYRNALQTFRRRERILQNHADFYGLYGTLCEYAAQHQSGVGRRKLLARAERYYRRATHIDPQNFLGWHGRWRLACHRRDPRCVALFRRAHRVAPRRGHIKCLGISYLVLGQPDRAIPYFRKALRAVRVPHEKMAIHYDLAISFQKLHNTTSARRHTTSAYRWFQKLPRSIRATPAFVQTKTEIEKMLTMCREHSMGDE